MLRRITAHAEYLTFWESDFQCRLPHFFIPVIRTEDAEFAYGITIVKRAGVAVVRNKLRRRIKAFMRVNTKLYPLGYKVNLIARDGAVSLPWTELCSELVELSQLLRQKAMEQEQCPAQH